jgi:mannosyltransferase OCH1-like enzyme
MIPKVIHYCWFGGKKKSKLVRDCISSWKKHLPDYQIIEWNETNSDLTHPFVKEAYACEKWAFVADYIRFKVIFNYGGVYLDTDMIVLKSLDNLLSTNCFLGAENSEYLNAAIIGATPNNDVVKFCLNFYDEIEFDNNDLVNLAIPKILTKAVHAHGTATKSCGEEAVNDSLTIYPNTFFYPFPYEYRWDVLNFRNYIKDESYTVHLWIGSWLELNEFQEFKKRNYLSGTKKVLYKICKEGVSIQYLKLIGYSVRRSFGKT